MGSYYDCKKCFDMKNSFETWLYSDGKSISEKIIEQMQIKDVIFYCENQNCVDYRIFNPKIPRHILERKGKCHCGFFYVPVIHWCRVIDDLNGFNEEKEENRIISKEQRYIILKEQKWSCNICGEKLKYSNNSDWEGKVAHIDHIHPFSQQDSYKGFSINERKNLQALCPECNIKKSNKKVN